VNRVKEKLAKLKTAWADGPDLTVRRQHERLYIIILTLGILETVTLCWALGVTGWTGGAVAFGLMLAFIWFNNFVLSAFTDKVIPRIINYRENDNE